MKPVLIGSNITGYIIELSHFKGGQYLDGTTDTTRTFHYGQPTEFEIEAYTRVLMGAIDLARVTFIKDHGTTDSRLDILARLVVLQVEIFRNINVYMPIKLSTKSIK